MSQDLPPVLTTGIGSWPGTDIADALKINFSLAGIPYLPELPGRGAPSAMIGRGTAFLSGLAVDLQPAGWRLTDASSREHRLARATVRSDLDQLEEQAQDYEGSFKVSVAGAWTLSAMMERPRGDRVLADHGARRELAQSLNQGVADLAAELQRRLPKLELIMQVDEPMLPAVLAGSIPTASGFSRHRVVDIPEVSGVFTALAERLNAFDRPVPVIVHSCAADIPIGMLHRAGVAGISVDQSLLGTRGWDEIAAALDAGVQVWLGAQPTSQVLGPDEVARRVLGGLRPLELDPLTAARVVITPACGLAGSDRAAAITTMRTLRSAAEIVTDQLAE